MNCVIEQLKNENLIDIIQLIITYYGEEGLEIFNYKENDNIFFEDYFHNDFEKLVNAILNGNYNSNAEYVTINNYGNLETITEKEYKELLNDYIEEIAGMIIDNFNDLKEYFSNDLQNVILQFLSYKKM